MSAAALVIAVIAAGALAVAAGGVTALLGWRRGGRGAIAWGLAALVVGCVAAGVPLGMGWITRAQGWGQVPLIEVAVWLLTGGLAAAGLGLAAWGLVGRRPRGRECLRCRYDMNATAGMTCPECGRTAKRERELVRRRRRRWAIAAGVLLVVLGGGVWTGARVRDGTWPRYVPGSVLVLLMPHIPDGSALHTELRLRLGSLTARDEAGGAGAGPPRATWWDRFIARRSALAVRDGDTWASGLLAIERLGARAAAAAPILLPLVDDPDAVARRRALAGLASIHEHDGAPDPGPVLAAASRALTDEDERVRLAAVIALQNVLEGRGVTIPLPPALADMARGIGPGAGPKFAGYLRAWAVKCLAHCEVGGAWWEVIDVALTDPEPAVRREGLLSLAARLPRDERSRAAIARALGDDAGAVRGAAIGLLLESGAAPERVLDEVLALAALAEADRTAAAAPAMRAVVGAAWPAREKVRVFEALLADGALWPVAAVAVAGLGTDGAALLPRLRTLAEAADREAARLRELGPITYPSERGKPTVSEIRAAEERARRVHVAIEQVEAAVREAEDGTGGTGRRGE